MSHANRNANKMFLEISSKSAQNRKAQEEGREKDEKKKLTPQRGKKNHSKGA